MIVENDLPILDVNIPENVLYYGKINGKEENLV